MTTTRGNKLYCPYCGEKTTHSCPEKLVLGMYRVYWTEGGTSLAAIGQHSDGRYWIAPTNWLNGAHLLEPQRSKIERLELLETE